MTQEWANAKDVFIRYDMFGEFRDNHGTINRQPALIIASGAGGEMVIEGTEEELLTMLSRAQQLIVDK